MSQAEQLGFVILGRSFNSGCAQAALRLCTFVSGRTRLARCSRLRSCAAYVTASARVSQSWRSRSAKDCAPQLYDRSPGEAA